MGLGDSEVGGTATDDCCCCCCICICWAMAFLRGSRLAVLGSDGFSAVMSFETALNSLSRTFLIRGSLRNLASLAEFCSKVWGKFEFGEQLTSTRISRHCGRPICGIVGAGPSSGCELNIGGLAGDSEIQHDHSPVDNRQCLNYAYVFRHGDFGDFHIVMVTFMYETSIIKYIYSITKLHQWRFIRTINFVFILNFLGDFSQHVIDIERDSTRCVWLTFSEKMAATYWCSKYSVYEL